MCTLKELGRCIESGFHKILKYFVMIKKKFCGIQSILLTNKHKFCGI